MELVINVIATFRLLLVLINKKLAPDSNIKDTPETGLPRFGSCPVTMTGLSTVMVAPIAVPSTGC